MSYKRLLKTRNLLFIVFSSIIIILCVFFSCISSNAESNTSMISEYYGFNPISMGFHNFWNTIDFENSSLYDSEKTPIINGSPVPIVNGVADTTLWSELSLYLDGDSSNGELKLPNSFSVGNDTYSLSDFPYFLIYYNRSNWKYEVILFDNIDNLYNSFTASSCQLVDLGNRKVVQVECDSDGSCTVISYRTPNHWAHDLEVYDIGSYACSNFPICSIDSSKLNDNWLKEQVEAGYIAYWYCLCGLPYGDTNEVGNYETDYGNYSELLISNINYLLTDGSGGAYTNPVNNESYGGSNDRSDEDIENNDYLGEDNAIIMNASSLENGYWRVFLDWNNNQLTQKDKYSINATFELTGNVTFEGSGNYEEICIDTYNLTPNQEGVYILDKTFSYSTSLNANSGNYYDFNFSNINDGLSSNGKTALPFIQLVDKMKGTNDVKSGTTNLISDLFSGSYSGFRIPLFQSHNQISYNNLTYTCTIDVINIDTNESILTNPLSQPYNMLTGEAGTFINGGVDQSTVDNVTGGGSGYQGTISSGDWNSSSSSTGGGSASSNSNNNSNIESGAIVINNNPTFNNNTSDGLTTSESSLTSSGLLGKIINLVAQNKSTSVDTIEEISGSTGYISYLTSTFTFIPTTVWSAISVGFIACIGVAVVAFIISIVIKFIT